MGLIVLICLVIVVMISIHCWYAPQRFARFCVYIRLLLGFIFLTSGFGKLAHQVGIDYSGLIGPVWLEDKLAPHGLALLGRFIAYAQVVTGLCLLSSRLVTLGAIMLVPMLLCIWVVTISLDSFRNTSIVVTAMLIMNGSLLIKDWHKLKFIFTESIDELRPLQPAIHVHIGDVIWCAGALITMIAVGVFQYWPAYGPRTVKTGLWAFIVSSFFYLRHARRMRVEG